MCRILKGMELFMIIWAVWSKTPEVWSDDALGRSHIFFLVGLTLMTVTILFLWSKFKHILMFFTEYVKNNYIWWVLCDGKERPYSNNDIIPNKIQ